MVRQFVDNEVLPIAEKHDHEDSFPDAGRRADEGARPVRSHHPRGVRRDGARPHDLRDDRRGALAWLDLGLGHRQHALHRLLPADEVRDRRAEAASSCRRWPPARSARPSRSPSPRWGRTSRASSRTAKKADDGDWELNGQKMWVTNGLRSGVVFVLMKTRSEGRPALQWDDLLHHREGAGRARERRPDGAAADQEDGLQGRRVHRAGLRRLPLPARAHPRRRGAASARASAR